MNDDRATSNSPPDSPLSPPPTSPLSILSSPPKFSDHATFDSPTRDTASEASPAKLMLPGDRMMRGDPPSPATAAVRPSKRVCLRYDPVNFARTFAHMAPHRTTPARVRGVSATPARSVRSSRQMLATPNALPQSRRQSSKATTRPRSVSDDDSPPPHVASLMSLARNAQDVPAIGQTPRKSNVTSTTSMLRSSPTQLSANRGFQAALSTGKMSLISSTELVNLRANNNVLRDQNLAFAQTNASLTHRVNELESQLSENQAGNHQGQNFLLPAIATPVSTSTAAIASFSFTPAPTQSMTSPTASTSASRRTSYSTQMTSLAITTMEDEIKQAKEELENMTAERTLYWECCLEFAHLEKLSATDLQLTRAHVTTLMSRITELEQELSNATRAKQTKTLELSQLAAIYQNQLMMLQNQMVMGMQRGGTVVRDFGGTGGGHTTGDMRGQTGYPELGGSGMQM